MPSNPLLSLLQSAAGLDAELATVASSVVLQAVENLVVMVDAQHMAAVEVVDHSVACQIAVLAFAVALVVLFQADAETRRVPTAVTATTLITVKIM